MTGRRGLGTRLHGRISRKLFESLAPTARALRTSSWHEVCLAGEQIMTRTAFSFVALSLSFALGACSSSGTNAAASDGGAAPPAAVRACPDVGAVRCDGPRIERCEAREGGTAWSDAVECPGDQACRDAACQDPTARQLAQAASIASLVDTLDESSAWHIDVDAAAVKERERRAILKGDASDGVFFGAAWHTMNAYPQGHQGLFSPDRGVCGKTLPYQQQSRFGVCGRPSLAGLAVTYARAGNLLGLAPGDVIVSAGGDTGDDLFEKAYARPVCGGIYPAASGRRYAGATAFFGSVPAGMKLTVRAADGATREVTVPAESDTRTTDCADPFGRSTQIYAEATVRPDGVAVIRLPSFLPFDKPLPTSTDPAVFKAFADAYQAEIVKVFDSVKSAPAIIWDARNNSGGISPVGLAIVGGFASARSTAVSYCKTRIAGSSPPAFDGQRYAVYAVEPGGPFAYTGKVAVVTDGLAYSAGDYFPLAVARASDAPIVGSSSAGAFGGGRAPIDIDGPPKLSANYDPTGCFDAATDKPLEGAPPPPKVAVEYDADDLAAGKDTIVERAVKELGF